MVHNAMVHNAMIFAARKEVNESDSEKEKASMRTEEREKALFRVKPDGSRTKERWISVFRKPYSPEW